MPKKKKEENFTNVQQKKREYEDGDIVFSFKAKAKDYADFCAYNFFSKRRMQVIIIMAMIALAGLVPLKENKLTIAIIIFSLAILFPLLFYLLQRATVILRLNSNEQFKKTYYQYIFGEKFTAITREEKRKGKAQIEYNEIYEIVERKKYYFVYVDNKNAFLIKKAGIIQGNIEEINRLFEEKIKERYKKDKA